MATGARAPQTCVRIRVAAVSRWFPQALGLAVQQPVMATHTMGLQPQRLLT